MSSKKHLLLGLDAFGTLFSPRAPIAAQYAEVARKHGLAGFSDEDVHSAFRKAFKETAAQWPNYGKTENIGASRWWKEVISRTFTPFVDVTHQLPERLVPDLIHRFSSSEGYSIYPDVKPFFDMLQQVKKHGRSGSDWPWSSTTVGVITNSDDRIPGILESLGLSVGRRSIEKVRLSPQDGAVTDVSFVVLSYDVGCEKPDTRIFDAAKAMFREALSTEAGVDVSTGFDDFTPLYVGDELEKDVLGAIAAGWYPVLLDREGKYHERMITVRTGVTDSPYTRQFVPVMHDLRDLRFWRTS